MKKKGSVVVFVITIITLAFAICLCVALPLMMRAVLDSAANNMLQGAGIGVLFAAAGIIVGGAAILFGIGALGTVLSAIGIKIACNRAIRISSIVTLVIFAILSLVTGSIALQFMII